MIPMNEIEIYRAWRALMLTETGALKPDAEIVLRDLENMTGWMRTDLPVDKGGAVDPYKATSALATRAVFAKVKKRLFQDIRNMKRKEENDG